MCCIWCIICVLLVCRGYSLHLLLNVLEGDIRYERALFFWWTFFLASQRWLTVRLPSVEVTFLMAGSSRKHTFAISHIYEYGAWKARSSLPIMVRSASTNRAATSELSLLMRSGSWCSFHLLATQWRLTSPRWTGRPSFFWTWIPIRTVWCFSLIAKISPFHGKEN